MLKSAHIIEQRRRLGDSGSMRMMMICVHRNRRNAKRQT
jgi:hypothetical protein